MNIGNMIKKRKYFVKGEIMKNNIKYWAKLIIENMETTVSFDEIISNRFGQNSNKGYEEIINIIENSGFICKIIDENLLEFKFSSSDKDESIERSINEFSNKIEDNVNTKLKEFGLEIEYDTDDIEYERHYDYGVVVDMRLKGTINVIDYDKCISFLESIK